MSGLSWRVGTKLGRTLYRDDVLVGMVDTPAMARDIVAAMNNAEPYPSHAAGTCETCDARREDMKPRDPR